MSVSALDAYDTTGTPLDLRRRVLNDRDRIARFDVSLHVTSDKRKAVPDTGNGFNGRIIQAQKVLRKFYAILRLLVKRGLPSMMPGSAFHDQNRDGDGIIVDGFTIELIAL